MVVVTASAVLMLSCELPVSVTSSATAGAVPETPKAPVESPTEPETEAVSDQPTGEPTGPPTVSVSVTAESELVVVLGADPAPAEPMPVEILIGGPSEVVAAAGGPVTSVTIGTDGEGVLNVSLGAAPSAPPSSARLASARMTARAQSNAITEVTVTVVEGDDYEVSRENGRARAVLLVPNTGLGPSSGASRNKPPAAPYVEAAWSNLEYKVRLYVQPPPSFGTDSSRRELSVSALRRYEYRESGGTWQTLPALECLDPEIASWVQTSVCLRGQYIRSQVHVGSRGTVTYEVRAVANTAGDAGSATVTVPAAPAADKNQIDGLRLRVLDGHLLVELQVPGIRLASRRSKVIRDLHVIVYETATCDRWRVAASGIPKYSDEWPVSVTTQGMDSSRVAGVRIRHSATTHGECHSVRR